MGKVETVLSGLSILFAIAGTCGLILLSIFDTVSHPKGGYVISAIFICAEYQRLGVHFRQHRVLRASFWMKLFFIIIEFFLAVVFVATTFSKHKNIGAIFEWIIALIFTFYVLTFFVDLLPASRDTQKKTNLEMGNVDAAVAEHQNRYANGYDGAADAQRPKPPMAQNY
ncbi:MAG: hypothetical protein Q9220_002354 [cf. Caloplaca sp. 1 TL-2023]